LRWILFGCGSAALRLCAVFLFLCFTATLASGQSRWWKGNLHTHTLWSDGDDYPEMVVDWYKSHGYHFLVLSDHNILQEGDKWTPLTAEPASALAYEKYLDRFGPGWVQRRWLQTTQMVRLKTLHEFRGFYEQRDRFLLMLGEEISATYQTVPIHLNAVNLHKLIPPVRGASILDVIQKNVDAVLEQREIVFRQVPDESALADGAGVRRWGGGGQPGDPGFSTAGCAPCSS